MADWRLTEFITNDTKGVAVNRATNYLYGAFIVIMCSGFLTSGTTSLITPDEQSIPQDRVANVKSGPIDDLPHTLCGIDECMMAPTRIIPQCRQSERTDTTPSRILEDANPMRNVPVENIPASWEYSHNRPDTNILFARSDMVMMAKILLGDAVIAPAMRFASV